QKMLVLLLSKKENKHVFISLGTNLGDRKQNLKYAIFEIGKIVEIITLSSVYETEPFGVTEQPNFYNQVVEIKTPFSPEELLKILQGIEIHMGRVRTIRYGPRIIDLDILYYGDTILKTEELTIPHPGAAVRPTVLVPLCSIAPGFIDPVLHKSIEALVLLIKPREKEKVISLDVF
ncbi:MAG: 2-amino-4-hydroxy-6-hydroxymethyldihydropteridine diphosphokinase, partial [Nanoarchaeota archaeon]